MTYNGRGLFQGITNLPNELVENHKKAESVYRLQGHYYVIASDTARMKVKSTIPAVG